ncbi:hypothetical protein FACS189418_6010 [Clostridia bacterium]|nr:hypothetical protein FACS189418_6010 [Clostridia bacterium]
MLRNTDLSIKQQEKEYSLSYLSHELHNALTLVSSTVQLLEQNQKPEKHSKYIQDLKANIQYMKDLLSDFSFYQNSGQIQLSLINMSFLIQEIYAFCKPLAQEHSVTLNLSNSPFALWVQADALKLKQALINLIKNSLEAVQSFSGYIHLSLGLSGKYILISISDNGKGFSAEKTKFVFQPFMSDKENGTGLGLSFAKKIIEAHQGNIRFFNKPNQGVVFHIFLPQVTKIAT